MCKRSSGILCVLVLALFSAQVGYTLSPKETAINNLIQSEISLTIQESLIDDSENTILVLSKQIAMLRESLESSANKSDATILDIESKLSLSSFLLDISERDLEQRKILVAKLRKEFEALEFTYNLDKTVRNVAFGVIVIETAYIVFDLFILPNIRK